MKERPILFSGPMVRALLDGSKTQTRRVVKPDGAHHLFQFRGTSAAAGADEPTGEWGWCGSSHVVNKHIRCPYGKPGDRLWVRETWQAFEHGMDVYPFIPKKRPGGAGLLYAANDCDSMGWRPSIHMPRWASRITLEITDVRVERLQDISESDAQAEGVAELPLQSAESGAWWTADVGAGPWLHGRTPSQAFQLLWDSINGPGSWDANPWVWAITFRRLP